MSLATKPLVILTGLSGSGKTQIAMKFGEWLGKDRYLVAAVRPDWTGAEAVFGYEDALKEPSEGSPAWSVPEILAFLLRAAGDLPHPYMLVLDEMNLAHVERYFADVLSGMESGQPCLPNLGRDARGVWRLRDSKVARLRFPDNVFIVGTVNVDETTYMFSPKVLDRANTFEFRVRAADLAEQYKKPVPCTPGKEGLADGFLEISRDASWHVVNQYSQSESLAAHLRRLHELLAPYQFEFGHRVFSEAIRFAALHEHAGEGSMASILDRIVVQKLLPRLHGSRRRLELPLLSLAKYCYTLPEEVPDPKSAGDFVIDDVDPGNAELPVSFEKLSRMIKGLRANQFTSFTE